MDEVSDELDLFYAADGAEVLHDFIRLIGNQKLLSFKSVIHTGGKAGESLWSHVMNLVMIIEKLRPLFELEELEMRCLLLALVIHDLNKLEGYGKLPDGKEIRYAEVTVPEKLRKALESFHVGLFFPAWCDYLPDIKYLADAHQEKASLASQYNQKYMDTCRLDQQRLKGPLRFLMKAADVADNSHSGEYAAWHESHIRGKFMERLNEALHQDGVSQRYRLVGYRLAEFRGLLTNIIHNQMIAFLRATYGERACVDLLYHANGTDFLLDQRQTLIWTPDVQRILAGHIKQKFAELQAEQLAQFIKARPSGILVDDAAIESGASLETIFQTIAGVVSRKVYRWEWRDQREQAVRSDLKKFLAQEPQDGSWRVLLPQVQSLLAETTVLSADDETLKRGEFLMAYRNFLKDHREQKCKALKQDAWVRVARLFQVPEQMRACYQQIDPFRRGYAMARDLPVFSLDEMVVLALEDLNRLDQQAKSQIASGRKKVQPEPEEVSLAEEPAESKMDSSAIEDYLARHLQVWDDAALLSISPVAFQETLQRYVRDAHPERQCCYCGSALPATEWMAAQVPSSIGVQSFSNRLDAGSSREPKRNVCAICRSQFILEKLGWVAHKDKHGKELVTFYLHLFSYSFLTRPLLDAWWQSLQNMRDGDHRALFLKTREYFIHWDEAYHRFQSPVKFVSSGMNGLGLPTFHEAISNTPVLPLHIPGDNYGQQFLLAMEKTIMMANWFDCRVLLSRLPTPLLNLEHERIQKDGETEGEPVALLFENLPHALAWLLPRNALTRAQVASLCVQLGLLHRIANAITDAENEHETVYRLIVAAGRDPLALYYEIDRQIERTLSRQKAGALSPDQRALQLSAQVAPLAEQLLKGQSI
jgi:CRISPR-associated protein Csc3